MMLLHRTGRPEGSVNLDMAKSMEAPSSGLDSFWGSDNSFSTTGFPPSDYLHDKDTTYDMFLDSQNIPGPTDWTRDLSPFSGQVNRANAQDLFSTMPSAFPMATDPMVTDPFYCPAPPPALATNVSSTWSLGGSKVGDSTPDTAEPAFAAAPLTLGAQKKRKTSLGEEEDAALPTLVSPTTTPMPTTRTKRKASTAVRTQPKRGSAAKAPSVTSTASSASSSESSSHSDSAAPSSTRRSISGHGGNHNITLRTASRKPKPLSATKTEGNGRQGGGGKQQQQTPGGDPSMLSPSNGGGDGNGGDGVYANGQSNSSNNGNNNNNNNNNNDSLTSEERRARQNHNVVEKQYRNRLNSQFEKLLAILPANERDSSAGGSSSTASTSATRGGNSSGGGSGGNGGAAVVCDDRRMSKAEVLELARRRIHALEQERLQLRAERQKLLESATVMQQEAQRQQQQQQYVLGGGSL